MKKITRRALEKAIEKTEDKLNSIDDYECRHLVNFISRGELKGLNVFFVPCYSIDEERRRYEDRMDKLMARLSSYRLQHPFRFLLF